MISRWKPKFSVSNATFSVFFALLTSHDYWVIQYIVISVRMGKLWGGKKGWIGAKQTDVIWMRSAKLYILKHISRSLMLWNSQNRMSICHIGEDKLNYKCICNGMKTHLFTAHSVCAYVFSNLKRKTPGNGMFFNAKTKTFIGRFIHCCSFRICCHYSVALL